MLKMMTMNEYMPGAQEIVEDSADCFALNVIGASFSIHWRSMMQRN